MRMRGLIALSISVAIIVITPTISNAAAVVGFDAGNIIDDKTFTNSGSMSVSQIQSFLNSKVPVCDSTGQKLSELGGVDLNGDGKVQRWEYGQKYLGQTTFTCLKDYRTADGRSAAQYIYDKAQQYRINPQVMIVLLQKEMSFVTDDWPSNHQYSRATGYGCPDNSGGICNAQYYGFENQVEWSFKMFRAIMDNSPSWYTPYVLGNNYIQYNPNASCGGSNVTIQNRATQALYNYTPYQPNQSALNAGWGSGDGCGAYGNRNFYLYFNEWFGGYLISTVDNGNLYIRGANGTFYQITSYAQLIGLGIDVNSLRVYNTTSAYLSNLTSAGPLTAAVQFNSIGDVYSIDSNRLHYFSAAAYAAYGRPTVSNLAAGLDGGLIPRGNDMTTVVAENNVGNLYSVNTGSRRYISGALYKSEGYSSIPISWMSQYFVNAIPKGAPILPAGTVVQAIDTKVASVINPDRSSKRTLAPEALASSKVTPFSESSSVLDKLPSSSEAPVSVLSKDSIGNLFIIDGNRKILLNSSQLASINKTSTDFTLVDDSYLNQFKTVNPGGGIMLFWLDGGTRVYRSELGEMVAIINQNDFTSLGYSFTNVVDLNSATVSQIFTNNDRIALPPGTLFSLSSSGRVFIIDDNKTAHVIPTGDIFNNFSLSWQSIRYINQPTFDYYTQSNAISLSPLVTTPDGNRWLVTSGRYYGLPTQLSLSYDPTGNRYTPISDTTLSAGIRGRDATRFIRVNNDARVYYIDNGVKYPLGSVSAYNSRGGYSWDQVISVAEIVAQQFPTGETLY